MLLEAWANGKPNLVYRAGGPAEIVRDEVDGLHARCGDVEGLAKRLGRLVDDPGLRACARRSAAANGSPTSFDGRIKLEVVRSVFAGAHCNFRDDEIHVAVRPQHVQHRALARARLLDRLAEDIRGECRRPIHLKHHLPACQARLLREAVLRYG